MGNVAVHDGARGGRRVVAPQRVDDVVERDDLVGPQGEKGEQAADAGSADRDRAITVEQLDGSEQLEARWGPGFAHARAHLPGSPAAGKTSTYRDRRLTNTTPSELGSPLTRTSAWMRIPHPHPVTSTTSTGHSRT